MLMIGGLTSAILVWDHPKWHALNQVLYILTFMDISLMCMIIPFGLIHGFLLLQGITTVEFFELVNGRSAGRVSYQLDTVYDCIYQAFGSYSIIEIMTPLNLS